VFVVGTARSGSVTFSKACEHITNFTSAHESVFKRRDKLDYPDNHIEVSTSLGFFIPLLREKYGSDPDKCLIVHLRRQRQDCVPSMARLQGPYGHTIDVWASCLVGRPENLQHRQEIAGLIYDATHANIEAHDPDLVIHTDEAFDEWAIFWDRLDAEGNFAASRNTWRKRFNTGQQRGEK
jgi:hypothetical protein